MRPISKFVQELIFKRIKKRTDSAGQQLSCGTFQSTKDMKLHKYKKKPVVIEARQFKTNNAPNDDHMDSLVEWMNRETPVASHNSTDIFIQTLEGTMTASVGDYIIKGVRGEFYPCKMDIFSETYYAVGESGLSFGEAVDQMKSGNKVCRKGWNGKGMFIVMTTSTQSDEESMPYVTMFTASGQWQPGWNASTADIFATDWMVAE